MDRVAIRTRVAASSTFRQLNQAIEDAEFEFQLHTVDQGLPRGLDLIKIGEFETDNAEIQQHDENVDVYQVVEHNPGTAVANGSFEFEKFDGFVDVETGDNQLLDDEDRKLNFFVDGVRLRVRCRVVGVGAVHQYDNWYV